MDLLTLQEAVDLSYDRGRYPDFFPVNIGDDFKLASRPELFVQIPNPRKVRIEISSFRGASCGAVHYYADIIADGINRRYYEEYNGEKRLFGAYGYLGEELDNLPREKRDIWGGNYHIGVAREVTQDEIKRNPQRWEHYDPGDHTNAFNTAEEAEATALAIVYARFSEEWKVIVVNPYIKIKR
jgi:hypothetical protein|nr:MAG TPA: hypothetical protein [Caudoviricetes sp.]